MFSAFQFSNFRYLWVATLFVAGGVWLQQVSLGWLAYEMTGSPLHVGAILGTRTAPMLFTAMSGVIADRVDRRKLLMVDQALVATLVLGFSVVLLMGKEQVWHLYLFAALFGVLWAFNNPIRQVLVSNCVPASHLMNAVALNSMSFNTMRAIGPALGGFFILFFGPGINFLLQAFLFFIVLLILIPFRTPYALSDRSKTRSQPMLQNLKEGLGYLAAHPVARTASLVTFALMMLSSSALFNQLPVYTAERLLNEDGSYLGLLFTAMGVGGLLSTIYLARFSSISRKGRQGLVASAGAILSLALLSQVTALWLAMIVVAVQQAFLQVVLTTNLTTVQSLTPDELRGRVTGVYQMEVGMMLPGGVAAGALASLWGVDVAFLSAACAAAVVLAIIAYLSPSYRKLQL